MDFDAWWKTILIMLFLIFNLSDLKNEIATPNL